MWLNGSFSQTSGLKILNFCFGNVVAAVVACSKDDSYLCMKVYAVSPKEYVPVLLYYCFLNYVFKYNVDLFDF